ncbi:PREDICTED: TNF receptor-associated factor 2-like isoform X2 [Amphimedon queenslandica]|uniref:TRAF-type domain-containing protein n=1 Tax=Amphimedon queenslandica TaxID=400682 RepID=A0AAN0JZM6_AMPQE|nr:PREDICTED: TNF receptor-associated factor 2-like isoform X2 [Amphimedon queenslandica]|eukprot:XP_019862374.1 PREDICTED: TNF receptor-associated factor 2-like isoform X2 [Amphimedon queenslandica]
MAAANDRLGSSFLKIFKHPASSYGGYDYTFVDGDPPSNYICLICTLVSRDPHQVSCCYNIYCKSCLDKHRKKNSRNGTFRCPACRELLDLRSYFKDGRMEREIKALKVQCTIEECDWKGTIGDIEAHVMACPYRMVDCSLGCGEKICCREMETHLRDCPKRIVSCQYCKDGGPHDIITSSAHLDECRSYPIKCSNEGCEFIEERFWFKYHQKRCPKAIVYCEYSNLGCDELIKREEQEKHNEEFSKEHLQMAIKQVDSLQTKCTCSSSSKVFKTSGYKMMLCVYANGYGRGKGTHMSCYTVLVPGEYDDVLGWPFEGEVTVELLNQNEDRNHKKLIIKYDDSTPKDCKERVTKTMSERWGKDRFIAHSAPEFKGIEYGFLGPRYFRVSARVTSKTKPWLV